MASTIDRSELLAVNRRAAEVGAAVRYHIEPRDRFKRADKRLAIVRAVIMSQKDSNALAREHKDRRKALALGKFGAAQHPGNDAA